MTTYKELKKLYKGITLNDIDALLAKKAAEDLLSFTKYTMPDYRANWHHKKYAAILDKFAKGEIKRLIVNMPPQHGKSEMSTRRLPAFLLGLRPSVRIGVVAYNSSFASKFNRAVQRIIDENLYQKVFPDTTLSGKNVRTISQGSWLRNSHEFEIVGHGGSFLAIGVGGPLTGNKIDVAIIDDPYKDSASANSEAYNRMLKEWWDEVLMTRLHNDSRIVLTNTRWRHDDLTGHIIKRHRDGLEEEHWHIVTFPAIKEGQPTDWDPREIGEPLWPSQLSLDKLLIRKEANPESFEALYQQNPTPKEGNKIKDQWLRRYRISELPEGKDFMYIDTSQSESHLKNNDPAGILVFRKARNRLYLRDFQKGRWGTPDLVAKAKDMANKYFKRMGSAIYIENKDSGRTVKQLLQTQLRWPLILDNPVGGKEQRVADVENVLKGGQVWIPEEDTWVSDFLKQVKGFPKMKHDEEVDCLTGACRMTFSVDKLNEQFLR